MHSQRIMPFAMSLVIVGLFASTPSAHAACGWINIYNNCNAAVDVTINFDDGMGNIVPKLATPDPFGFFSSAVPATWCIVDVAVLGVTCTPGSPGPPCPLPSPCTGNLIVWPCAIFVGY